MTEPMKMVVTCDCCAEAHDDCIIVGDAYVCAKCRAFHEEGITVAAAAVSKDFALFGNLHGKAIELGPQLIREIVAVAVKAYIEHGGEHD